MAKMEMVVIVLGLLAMVQQSMQLSLKNPLPIRSDDVPAFGLVTTSEKVENALFESGFFRVTSHVDLFGRRFVIGEIHKSPVVFVRSSNKPSVHAGITVQIMADHFNLRGIIHFGTAGSTDNSLTIGTVIVPAFLRFTGFWEWLNNSNEQGQLVFGEYNLPSNGQNSLGSIKFNKIDIFKWTGEIMESFYVYPDPGWSSQSMSIEIPSVDVVVGLESSSSDIYVSNSAYRDFLRNTFNVSTVDTSGVAVGLGATSNRLRFVSIQAVSNFAGAPYSPPEDSELASKNVVEAVSQFIKIAFSSAHDL